MDVQTRMYLKKMIEEAAEAQLLVSVLQRFQSGMSDPEILALQKCILILSSEAKEYLGIGAKGELLEMEEQEYFEPMPESLPEPMPEPMPEDPAGVAAKEPESEVKTLGKKKKDGYT